MSERDLRQGLRDHLERLAAEGALGAVPVTEYGVRRLLELSRTDWERAADTMRFRPDDFDLHYKLAYEALLTGAEAVLAALGYRARGADGSHDTAFRVACYALVPGHEDIAHRLSDLKDHARSMRRRATYERVGVVSRRERDEFVSEVAPILGGLERVACDAVGLVPPGHAWTAPG